MSDSPCTKLAKNPWLIPFVQAIAGGVAAKPSDLSNYLGVRSSSAKAALWKMRRMGLLEEGAVKPEVVECLRDLKSLGRRFVWKWGSNYFLVVVKRTRVSAYTVPVDVVERVRREGVSAAGVEGLAQRLKHPPILLSRALRILEVLDPRAYYGKP